MVNKFRLLALSTYIILIATGALSCIAPPWDDYGGFPFTWSPFIGLPFGLIGIGLYFLPTILAAARHAKSMLGIILLNIFAGWTFIGWIIALVWALTGKRD